LFKSQTSAVFPRSTRSEAKYTQVGSTMDLSFWFPAPNSITRLPFGIHFAILAVRGSQSFSKFSELRHLDLSEPPKVFKTRVLNALNVTLFRFRGRQDGSSARALPSTEFQTARECLECRSIRRSDAGGLRSPQSSPACTPTCPKGFLLQTSRRASCTAQGGGGAWGK
jgi:hypothetical protein